MFRASDRCIGRASSAVVERGATRTAATFLTVPAGTRANRQAMSWLLVVAVAVFSLSDAVAVSRQKHMLVHRTKDADVSQNKHRSARHIAGSTAAERRKRAKAASSSTSARVPLPLVRPALASLPPDFAAAKQAIELIRRNKPVEATTIKESLVDPVMQKLVEWVLLRRPDSEAGFGRYVAFIDANPDWPSIPLLRRRAEMRLWQERRDATTVRRFIGHEPSSAIGRLALARMLMAADDHVGAEREVRAAWHSAELSAESETAVLAAFPDVLTRADHRARMDRRIGAKDFGAAMRAARRLGADEMAIVKSCVAAAANSANARTLLDAVPSNVHGDLGYALCRIHWLLRHDDVASAAKLVLAAQRGELESQNTDEWWRERRVLARRLLDLGDAKTAYRVVCEAASPANPYYRAEWQFMAGWIALRFMADPSRALAHFVHVDDGSIDPIVLARAAYWRGRAAEEAGQFQEMRTYYEAAAGHPTAYYGQLARARLGLGAIELRTPPTEPVQGVALELVRAADILYALGEPDLVAQFVADLAERSRDAAMLAGLAHVTASHNDARATLLIGKAALARDLALELYAFPVIGVPRYNAIGPELDRSVVYSVVRTESAFDQRDVSPAKAVGLMQVTPEAGRDTAKRFGVAYDWKRLVSDPIYNTQMGAAEVAALLKDYRGSFLMAFAGYNAGRGRVDKWVAQHGDPRDPNVDAVDWVERIPFAETRNYVQRVMENLQVYRARFGVSTVMVEPNLQRSVTFESSAEAIGQQSPSLRR
jgi:soluble lytic murein transglycosylase